MSKLKFFIKLKFVLVNNWVNNIVQTQQLRLSSHFELFPWDDIRVLGNRPHITEVSPTRLGYYAEKQFFNLIRIAYPKMKLMTNIQIIEEKRTLGELDALLVNYLEVKHIEFCYKIYLFDPSLSEGEFDCWIGPNRRDSLKQKVTKLQEKQLALFNHYSTLGTLKGLIPRFNQLKKTQAVCFLAQLYVPRADFFKRKEFNYGIPDGFYIYFNQISELLNYQWFIPDSKIKWIDKPKANENWVSATKLKENLIVHYHKESNPLCWAKSPDNELHKVFVVNWKNSDQI